MNAVAAVLGADAVVTADGIIQQFNPAGTVNPDAKAFTTDVVLAD